MIDDITQKLRQMILEGNLEAGDYLPPAEVLAERFGTSSPVAYQAIRVLAAEGLIVTQPGKGTRVQPDMSETLIRSLPQIEDGDRGFDRSGETRAATMLNIALEANSTLDLDVVVSYVVEALSTAFGNRFKCQVALVDEVHELLLFRPTSFQAGSQWELAQSVGYFSGPIPFAKLTGLAQEALQRRGPAICYDTENDPRVPAELARKFGTKSMVALPILASGQIVALIWMSSVGKHHTFNQNEIHLVEGIANVVGMAIENARLHSKVKEQAIIEERQRLSRELHDNLAQALSILKIRSALAAEFLAAQHIERADSVLQEMREIAAKAYTDVREAIFNLRSAEIEETEFAPLVQHYLNHYRASFGVNASLELHEQIPITLSPRASTQALRIIQEALSNVRKHSQVDAACVNVESNRTGLCVQVEDDGQGFDIEAADSLTTNGVGLSVMRERAESIGGQLTVESKLGRGTRVTLYVPWERYSVEEHDVVAYPAGG